MFVGLNESWTLNGDTHRLLLGKRKSDGRTRESLRGLFSVGMEHLRSGVEQKHSHSKVNSKRADRCNKNIGR